MRGFPALQRLDAQPGDPAQGEHPGPATPCISFGHSALVHAAEDGWSTPMLMAWSRHKSVPSLAKYARPRRGAPSRRAGPTRRTG